MVIHEGLKRNGGVADIPIFMCTFALDYQSPQNVVFIEQGMPQSERLMKLNQIAIHQMSILESDNNDRKLLK